MSLRLLPLLVGFAFASTACSSDTNPNPGVAGTTSFAGTSGSGTAGSSSGAGGQPVASAGSGGAATSGAGGGGGSGGTAGAGGTGGGTAGAGSDPVLLSQTGLFADIKDRSKLATGVFKYAPAYALWSDGATKQRYVYMPADGKIDTTDMEFWQYPAGFKLWKDFSRDGKLIETRLLMKRSSGATDWYMISFRWRDDYSDADASVKGEMNAMGTMHDVPSQADCKGCHEQMPDNALGFSALQLSHSLPDSLNLTQIATMGWLSAPPTTTFALPGTPAEQKALGYMHANCGMCHSVHGHPYTTKTSFDAWTHLDAPELASVETTRAFLSLMCDAWPPHSDTLHTFANPPLAACPPGHVTGAPMDTDISHPKRAVPTDPSMSAIVDLMTLRMNNTGDPDSTKQMPPLATEIPDTAGGIADVSAWITSVTAK